MTLSELRRTLKEMSNTNDVERMINLLTKVDGLNTYLRDFYQTIPRLKNELEKDLDAKELARQSPKTGFFTLIINSVKHFLGGLEYDNTYEKIHLAECHAIAQQALDKLDKK